MESATAMTFRLIAVGGADFELNPGATYRIGRGDAVDIHCADALASREHALLRWDPGRLWILEDLRSANGTWLGDTKVAGEVELSDQDVIRIGGSRYLYRILPPGAISDSDGSDYFAADQTVAIGVDAPSHSDTDGDTFAGAFSDFGFRDVIRFLALAGRTGRLFHDSSPGRSIAFRDGVPRQAVCGTQTGMAALRALANEPGVGFEFTTEDVAPGDDEIAGDAEAIVLDCFGDDEAVSPENVEMAQDLAKARDFQHRLLSRIPDISGYEIGLHYQGLNEVSGDFYDIGPLTDGRQLLLVGDVTGHGVQAALVVAWVLRSLRQLRRSNSDLAELLCQLNDEVRPDLLPGQFATLAAIVLEPATGKADLACVGHHPFVLLDQTTSSIRELGGSGVALGLAPAKIFADKLLIEQVELGLGSCLVQCTDGILEAAAPNGEEYGMERFSASLQETEPDCEAQDLVNWAAASLQAFSRRIEDDLTLLALRRVSESEAQEAVLDLAPQAKAGLPGSGASRSLARMPSLPQNNLNDSDEYAPVSETIPLPPRRIAGSESERAMADYLLTSLVRQEAGGAVHAAEQIGTGRTVELKIMREDGEMDDFLAEPRFAAMLEHPGILPIYDIGRDLDRGPFFAMQTLRGRDWASMLKRLGQRGNLSLLARLCDAVAYAHDRMVLHRDIKPHNVIIGQFGEAVLTGWELAAWRGPDDPEAVGLPRIIEGAVLGTPAYMAPEAANGEAQLVDEHTDVYGMGAILFQVLTGKPPHQGDDADATLAAASMNLIQDHQVSGPLMELALQSMASDPGERPVSVLAFKHELERRRT